MKLEIHCPVVATTETVDLPDSYENFDGEVACATPNNIGMVIRLRLKLVRDQVVGVKRA